MRIELRILSGARAGQSEVFDQPSILIGRKPSSDLRFDTHLDLDALAIAAYWFGHREATLQVAELSKMVAQSESTSKLLHARTSDTGFANAIARHSDSLKTRVQTTAASGNEAELAALKVELEK